MCPSSMLQQGVPPRLPNSHLGSLEHGGASTTCHPGGYADTPREELPAAGSRTDTSSGSFAPRFRLCVATKRVTALGSDLMTTTAPGPRYTVVALMTKE